MRILIDQQDARASCTSSDRNEECPCYACVSVQLVSPELPDRLRSRVVAGCRGSLPGSATHNAAWPPTVHLVGSEACPGYVARCPVRLAALALITGLGPQFGRCAYVNCMASVYRLNDTPAASQVKRRLVCVAATYNVISPARRGNQM